MNLYNLELYNNRWSCRNKNCHDIKINYKSITNALEEEINNNKKNMLVSSEA